MPNVKLEIDGKRFRDWDASNVTSSIENIADSFSLDVAADTNAEEEDPCKILIDDQLVLTGYVEGVFPSYDATREDFSLHGYSKASALVDCSVLLGDWSFRNATVLDIANKVCAPHGIPVKIHPDIKLAKAPREFSVAPGETGFEVILAAAKATGLLVVSTPDGGILLTHSGTEKAVDPLADGLNIIGASGNYNSRDRFYRYVALAQSAGTDRAFGEATRLRAEAFDEGVRRKNRVMILRPEAGHSVEYNRSYADWEARIRAANAKSVQIFVDGWTQSDGSIWKKNTVTPVVSKRLRLNGEERLISQVDFSHGKGGPVTVLRLVRPDAYAPSPSAKVK